jgi:hypothetical protein
MVQVLENLHSKCEALSSNTSTTCAHTHKTVDQIDSKKQTLEKRPTQIESYERKM